MDVKKQLLFSVLIIILLLPILQMNFNMVELKPLKGAFTLANKPDSIVTNWFSQKYQSQYNTYFNDHLGLREELVRFFKQIEFSVFNKVSNDNLVVGKDLYVLDEKYILAHLGIDFLGKTYWQSQIQKLKFIQKKLKTDYDINLTVILAPSKISFYRDKIPDRYMKLKSNERNYKEIIRQFKKQNINYIDFENWFLQIRDTSKILFPKYGIHWSTYGSILATDSLINFLKSYPDNSLPSLTINSIISNDSIAGDDMDLLSSLNLLFTPQQLKMSYPIFEFDHTIPNLKILAIGDSYYRSFQSTKIIGKISIFNNFMYYNQKTNDFKGYALKNYNNIILINTELNYWNLGHGCIEEIYEDLTYSTHKKELYNYFTNNSIDTLVTMDNINFDSINQKRYERLLSIQKKQD